MSQQPKMLPSVHFLRSILDYNPENGKFKWKYRKDRSEAWNSRFAGKEAGHKYTNTTLKYYKGLSIGITCGTQNHLYQAHRVAWKIQTGSEPPLQVDHENGCSFDNKWENLRDGSNGVNETNKKKYKNNKSGVTGVSEKNGKWRARVTRFGKIHHVGTFSKIEDAENAVNKFRLDHGFSDSHGVRGEPTREPMKIYLNKARGAR